MTKNLALGSLFFPLICCAALLAPAPVVMAQQAEGTITVSINGLRNNQGVVRVALFGSSETYNNDHNIGMGAFRQVVVPVADNLAVASFPDMPYGDYAVKAFHDENNSGKFLTGTFGKPRVEYAYSNDARYVLNPPSFAKARFSLAQPVLNLQIKSQRKGK
jgi:uncharacterized protein (DUF2141 family)